MAAAAEAIQLPLQESRRVLPGFGLTLGYTMVYLSLVVLIPMSAVFIGSVGMGWSHFWTVVATPRVLASLRMSFGASLVAASINAVFGLVVAWVLVRYTFPFRRLIDALVCQPARKSDQLSASNFDQGRTDILKALWHRISFYGWKRRGLPR